MKWLNNLQNIIDENKPGECPYCKSLNTDYVINIINDKTLMGYGAIWCNDCKKAFHISRIKATEKMKLGSIPKELKF